MAAIALSGSALSGQDVGDASLETVTDDGVRLFGDVLAGGLGSDAPVILLLHQGGSSARGEYGPIAPWLNGLGFRAVAWDLRAGGDRHGEPNRTVAARPGQPTDDYCGSHPDLQAALDATLALDGVGEVVVWGSSYSAALAFRLAAENPETVTAVVAFSPAAGGPMEGCLARNWLDRMRLPAIVFRPGSEMELASAQQQRTLLEAAGVDFVVVPDGVHGSSMLVDERTGHDMREVRARVAAWLDGVR